MAITPRTILTSAAPATVAVVSLYFFTVLGTAAFTSMTQQTDPQEPTPAAEQEAFETAGECQHVADRFSSEYEEWSEFAWVNYAYCYDRLEDSTRTIAAAAKGLEFHPRSEILYNLKGYHQIIDGHHVEAIETLRTGKEKIQHHRSGIMANNLAWAGLWEPREMDLEEARDLYVRSLARSPGVCESIHTGLFVEYGIANQATGLDRYDALKRFSQLRSSYNRCLDRLSDNDWDTIVEVVGAAVLFKDIDQALDSQRVHPLMRTAVRAMDRYDGEVTADEVCREAMPLADFHGKCVRSVEEAVEANDRLEQAHQERNERAAQVGAQLRTEHHQEVRSNGSRVEVRTVQYQRRSRCNQ